MIANLRAWRDLVREVAATEGRGAVLGDCVSSLALLAAYGALALFFTIAMGDFR